MSFLKIPLNPGCVRCSEFPSMQKSFWTPQFPIEPLSPALPPWFLALVCILEPSFTPGTTCGLVFFFSWSSWQWFEEYPPLFCPLVNSELVKKTSLLCQFFSRHFRQTKFFANKVGSVPFETRNQGAQGAILKTSAEPRVGVDQGKVRILEACHC